MKLLVSSYQN